MESINNTDRAEKAQIIENLLSEVGMSKQDLIDLLTNVVELEESQSIDLDEGKIFVKGANIISGEDTKLEISEVLSAEELNSLVNKIGLATTLLKAEKLGLNIDEDVAEMMGLETPKKQSVQSFIVNLKNLSKDQIEKVRKFLEEQIKNSQKKENKGLLNRFIGGVKNGINKASETLKDTLQVLDYSSDIARLRETAQEIESAHSSLKKFEDNIKERFPEVGRIKYRKGEVLASIDGLSSLVNLKEFIRSKGELDPTLMKMIDDAGSTASNMQMNLASLSKDIGGDIDGLGFDKSGKLIIEKQIEGTKKKIHIDDYLGDMDRLSRGRAKLKDKAEDDLEHKRELDLEELELEKEDDVIEQSAEKRDITINKEIKHEKDELVKLDIIADKSKIIEAQKLMREGMKDMKEASQNKDLLENIRKDLQKNRELNK